MDEAETIRVSLTDDGYIGVKLYSWFGAWRMSPATAEQVALAILQLVRQTEAADAS